MSATTAFILILTFTLIYIMLIQFFTVLFRITGLTKVKARFQAISLLTNCGYTTSESEIVLNSKVRRNLALVSMITGYVYSVIIVSLMINLLNNIKSEDFENNYKIFIISISVFALLFVILKIPFIKNLIEKFIEFLASVILKREKEDNIITLLDIYGKDAIVGIDINSIPEMMKDKHLSETNFREKYKLNILLLKRRGKVVEITRNTIFQNGDSIIVFGSYQNIIDLFKVKVKNVDLLDVEDKVNENELNLIDNYGVDAMVEIKINNVPSLLNGITLYKSRLKEDKQINILMIKRNDMPVTVNKDTIINKNDVIIVFGPYKNIKQIFLKNED